MANERITVHHGADGNDRNTCWLKLGGKHLWGGFQRESLAQDCADRLNAAFDQVEADARLAWTTKPTKPGWYVFKFPRGYPCQTGVHVGCLRQVLQDEDGLYELGYGPSEDTAKFADTAREPLHDGAGICLPEHRARGYGYTTSSALGYWLGPLPEIEDGDGDGE